MCRLFYLVTKSYLYMLWFNFIFGLNFIFLCFKLIMISYITVPKNNRK